MVGNSRFVPYKTLGNSYGDVAERLKAAVC